MQPTVAARGCSSTRPESAAMSESGLGDVISDVTVWSARAAARHIGFDGNELKIRYSVPAFYWR